MSIIGEAALSALFDVLFDKLISSDLLNIFKQEQVDADLKKWKTVLDKIHAVLDDAEEKQEANRLVKLWLGELEDLAYDADDILDEFSIEALRRKLINEERSTSKVRKFIPTCFVGLTPTSRSIVFDANMRSKIKVINTRLQEIVTQKNDLQLTDNAGARTRTRVRARDPETSLVNKDRIYGRDEAKKAIVDLLLSGESSNTQLGFCFSVIPILGMGGLGKTTLAQLVYNDDNVSRHFDLKAWVCVSEDYDTARVTKEILQDIIKQTCNDSDLNLLHQKLEGQLSGKKFLLILDDVWNENKDDWSNLCKPFESGAQGSKIIITTRIGRVTSIMGATQPHQLEALSDDACLTIFTQNALGTTDFSAHPELEEIGRKILKRCKGSPLAAKVLGGLCSKHDRVEWERVLNKKISDIGVGESNIFPILKLSYQYLPSHLKRCFAYCSLFPKDYEFKEKELVLLWMAEGLVPETKRNESMEDLGGEYFRDLLGRSFFQQSSRHYKPRFVMHDLINDLARWAAGGLCYILEDTMGGNMQSKISTKVRVRHFSYIRCEYDDIKKFEDFPKDMHLRTFLQLVRINKDSHSTNHALSCLLPKLRYLRVLSLGGYEIVQLPDSIGDLKHLRYFNLSNTKIRSLPESLSLYKLQTLILKGCSALQSLPISNCTCLENATIKECNSLTFIFGGQLPSTLKWLKITNCENLQWVADEGETPFSSSSLLMNEENRNTSLFERLEIWNCPSLKCLSSRGDLPATLKILEIHRCSKLTSLSSSGQLPTALKHLNVWHCPKLESVADKLHDNASLEYLEIMSCEKLKSLPEGLHKLCHLIKMEIGVCSSLVSFPDGGLLPTSLRELEIDRCEKLEALPNRMHNLTSLERLSILHCPSIISFPEEGYPTNLTSLSLRGVNICKQVFEWGLHRLTSLTYLFIMSGFPDWQSFPSEEEDGKMMMTLPTSLTILSIQDFPNIVFLSSKGFQNLSALQQLWITFCPKLEFLPEKGLPPSLLELNINYCPLLEKHCKKGKGREWLKIANIPQVLFKPSIPKRWKRRSNNLEQNSGFQHEEPSSSTSISPS